MSRGSLFHLIITKVQKEFLKKLFLTIERGILLLSERRVFWSYLLIYIYYILDIYIIAFYCYCFFYCLYLFEGFCGV